MTSVLLRAMEGTPLTADAATGLMASESRAALNVIFNTEAPSPANRWKAIFVHHSRTAGGSAATLTVGPGADCGDHFVVGNGDGAVDGEVQFTRRWNLQQPADPAPGRANIDASCVSICVVGDFDKTAPTPTQLRRLEHLVQTLQERYRVPASQVWLLDYPGSNAGVGKYFPGGAFQRQLLR